MPDLLTYRQEVYSKLVHISSSSIAVLLWYFGKDILFPFILISGILFLVFDYSRKYNPYIKNIYYIFFFYIYIVFFFLISKIKNNKVENVKKFIIVKLYGAKPSIVIAPSRKGAKNMTKNLLLSKEVKLNPLLLTN